MFIVRIAFPDAGKRATANDGLTCGVQIRPRIVDEPVAIVVYTITALEVLRCRLSSARKTRAVEATQPDPFVRTAIIARHVTFFSVRRVGVRFPGFVDQAVAVVVAQVAQLESAGIRVVVIVITIDGGIERISIDISGDAGVRGREASRDRSQNAISRLHIGRVGRISPIGVHDARARDEVDGAQTAVNIEKQITEAHCSSWDSR